MAVVSHSLYYDASQIAQPHPKVVTVYDMLHERLGAGRALRVLKKRAVLGADCLVAISNATARDITTYFTNSPRTVVIPLGLSAGLLEPPPDPFDIGRPYLLYVGPRHGYKNFKVLVEALPQLARHGLALVLAGGEPLTDGERRELALNVGAGDALLHVRPGDRELARLYDGAAVTVITSNCEGFGLPLLEAMARGCPVASSSGGSLPEVAAGRAELFDPNSAVDCAEAVGRALGRDSESLLEAATYARTFTWEKAAQRHVELYQELLLE
jgi:glycosyltransferase involved in cell wall biosynthesis